MFSSFGRFSWIRLCFQIVGQLRIKTCQHFKFHFWKCWQKLRQFEIDRKLYYNHIFLQNPNTFTLYWRLHKNLFTVYHLIVSCFYLHNIFHIKKKLLAQIIVFILTLATVYIPVLRQQFLQIVLQFYASTEIIAFSFVHFSFFYKLS